MGRTTLRTVGELRDVLQNLPAEMPLISDSKVLADQVTMGTSGCVVKGNDHYAGIPRCRVMSKNALSTLCGQDAFYI